MIKTLIINISPYLAVGVGGMGGAVCRYLLGNWIKVAQDSIPVGTLVINLSGSFLLGVFLTLFGERVKVSNNIRLFGSSGFLGAYTTFSTFTVELTDLFRSGYIFSGLLYIVLSLIGGMLAVWLGFRLAHKKG
jgi:CrcB protein